MHSSFLALKDKSFIIYIPINCKQDPGFLFRSAVTNTILKFAVPDLWCFDDDEEFNMLIGRQNKIQTICNMNQIIY